MNKLYLIVPFVLAGLFAVIYVNHSKSGKIEAEQKAVEAAKVREADEAKKKEAERRAKADADARTAERLAAEKKKEDERVAKWEADGQRIATETTAANTAADRLAKEAAQLELQLNEARAAKERANREAFDLARAVETARIQKRTAELDLLRMQEMVANRAGNTSLARVPAAPTPAVK